MRVGSTTSTTATPRAHECLFGSVASGTTGTTGQFITLHGCLVFDGFATTARFVITRLVVVIAVLLLITVGGTVNISITHDAIATPAVASTIADGFQIGIVINHGVGENEHLAMIETLFR